MSPDPDFHESADAWLDGTGSEGQGKILQEILHHKPAASTEFAALARTHAMLELASLSEAERIQRASLLLKPALSSGFRRAFLHPLMKWSAAALIILGAAWMTVHFYKTPVESTTRPVAKKTQRKPTSSIPLTPVAQLPPADPAYGKFMEAFIIPEFQAVGLGLEEAIALLTDKVTAAGHADFKVELEEYPADDSTSSVHLNLKYQPASTLLQLIALQTGMKAYPSGQAFRLRLNQTPDSAIADTYKTTVGRWESFLQSQGQVIDASTTSSESTAEILRKRSDGGSNPPAAAALPDSKSVSAILLSAVHETPDLVEIIADPFASRSSRSIEIRCGPKLRAMLEPLLSGPAASGTLTYDIKWANIPNQAALEQILSSLPDPKSVNRTGGRTLLSEPAVPALLEALLANSAIKLETNPPLLIAPGGAVAALDTASPDASISDSTWTGRLCRITSKPRGSSIQCDLNIKYQSLRADGSIATTEQNSRFDMPVGMTLIQGGTKYEGGEEVIIFNPRLPEAIPYGIRVAGKPGFVRSPFAVEKGQVDIEGIPKNTKVKCPYTGQVFRVPE